MCTQIETIEGFIKLEYADGKINAETARELLRLLDQLKLNAINKSNIK